MLYSQADISWSTKCHGGSGVGIEKCIENIKNQLCAAVEH